MATRTQPLQRPKGTQDILPESAPAWRFVEDTARRFLGAAGYGEIRTPLLEYTELFQRGVGETTDIVTKEMYSFTLGDRQFTLRPEATAGLVRAFIEHGMSRMPKPVKVYTMGPMFRYERPQEGRQRQFHQIDVELFGLDSPAADAEAIAMAWGFLRALGLKDGLSLEVNNVGTPACRELFKTGFKKAVTPFLDALCENCQKRFHTNPLRMLDCKASACQKIYTGGAVQDFLETFVYPDVSRLPYEETLAILSALGIPYRKNVRLVRGLDYYTRTVFEITTNRLGAQNAVCGGGRYNGLVELLGGPETPATGWAVGVERLLQLIQAPTEKPLDYFIVTDRHAEAMAMAEQLRTKGFWVEVDLSGKPFGKQLNLADRRAARHVLIRGDAEAQAGQWLRKDLANGEQAALSTEQLLSSGPAPCRPDFPPSS